MVTLKVIILSGFYSDFLKIYINNTEITNERVWHDLQKFATDNIMKYNIIINNQIKIKLNNNK